MQCSVDWIGSSAGCKTKVVPHVNFSGGDIAFQEHKDECALLDSIMDTDIANDIMHVCLLCVRVRC